jgi:hypothetical protein
MAQARIRPFSLYTVGKKIGQLFQCKYKILAGDEPAFGDPGFLGMTDGATTTQVTATTIQPIAGMDYDLALVILQKQDVDVALGVIAGHIHMVTMRITSAEYDSDQKTGMLTGVFEFFGGEPKLT